MINYNSLASLRLLTEAAAFFFFFLDSWSVLHTRKKVLMIGFICSCEPKYILP